MATAAEVIADLQGRGFAISRDGPALRVVGPEKLVDPSVRQALAAHREEIWALLDASRPAGTVSAFRGDPRPDLADDAARWSRLLSLAWARDGSDRCGVFGSLLGMRCLGVELVAADRTMRLQARKDAPGDPPRWVTPEQYRDERSRWLDPHREAVIGLLAEAVERKP